MKETTDVETFLALDVRVGKILSARLNERARRPAYVLQLDMGEELGTKTSSAQLTSDYTENDLVGRRVIAVTNFPPLSIAGIKSEVLVLATVETSGRTLLIQPAPEVPLGTPIA